MHSKTFKKKEKKTIIVITMGLLLYCRQSAVDPHLFNRKSPPRRDKVSKGVKRVCVKC